MRSFYQIDGLGLLAILMMTFSFEFGSFSSQAQMIGLTAENITVFIVYGLVPSMILNCLWMLVFQFIFEKYIYKKETKL